MKSISGSQKRGLYFQTAPGLSSFSISTALEKTSTTSRLHHCSNLSDQPFSTTPCVYSCPSTTHSLLSSWKGLWKTYVRHAAPFLYSFPAWSGLWPPCVCSPPAPPQPQPHRPSFHCLKSTNPLLPQDLGNGCSHPAILPPALPKADLLL